MARYSVPHIVGDPSPTGRGVETVVVRMHLYGAQWTARAPKYTVVRFKCLGVRGRGGWRLDAAWLLDDAALPDPLPKGLKRGHKFAAELREALQWHFQGEGASFIVKPIVDFTRIAFSAD